MRAAQNPFQAWPAYSDITGDSILKDFHISAFQCSKSAIEFEKAHRTWMSSFMRAMMGRQRTKKMMMWVLMLVITSTTMARIIMH